MKISVLSLFPEILKGFFESSIMKRAVEKGLISYDLVNIRDFATDRHHKCDDEVYGGGAGMLMMAAPLGRALEASGARSRFEAAAMDAGNLGPGAAVFVPFRKEFIGDIDLGKKIAILIAPWALE